MANTQLEEKLFNDLTAKFPYLAGQGSVQRQRRIRVAVPYDNFRDVFTYAVDNLRFVILCTITGLDEGQTIACIYHIAREDGIILNIKTSVPKEKPVIKTITERFPAADIYERELADLLGMHISGLAEGRRYPLPDDWPAGEFPLRKDWKPVALKEKEGGQNA